jgi:hypothetical protein
VGEEELSKKRLIAAEENKAKKTFKSVFLEL